MERASYRNRIGFNQDKTDRWTGEIHSKYLKSPFKQLNRAIYLLRKEIIGHVWVNPIVFFQDEGFESLSASNSDIYFSRISDLVRYIQYEGKVPYNPNESESFFRNCLAADYLYDRQFGSSLRCQIVRKDLKSSGQDKVLSLKEIHSISIRHHFSYDELFITTKNGAKRYSRIENGTITVKTNGCLYDYSLSKLDYIELSS